MRFLSGSIHDWDFLVAEILRVLKPGGTFESSEPSPVIETDHGRPGEDSMCHQLVRILDEYGKMVDQTFAVVRNGLQRSCMVKAGFTDIQVKTFKVGSERSLKKIHKRLILLVSACSMAAGRKW